MSTVRVIKGFEDNVVIFRDGARLRLGDASQARLKFLHDSKHPMIEEDEPKPKKSKKSKDED